MNELIGKALDELHLAEPSRGINRFKKELIDLTLKHRRYEERQGKLVDQRGLQADLKADLRGIIDASGLIPRKGDPTNSKYVSPWNSLDDENLQKYSREMTTVFEKLFALDGFVPRDMEAYQKAIGILAKNFVYETSEDGEPVFRKLNRNGLIGERTFSFAEISLSIAPMADRLKSKIASESKQAEYRELAKRLINNPNPKPEYLDAKIKELKKGEIAISIPTKSLPQIPRTQVEQEFVKQEAVLRGLDVSTLSPNNRALLQNHARSTYDELSNTFEVTQAIKSIELKPAATWEGLTY